MKATVEFHPLFWQDVEQQGLYLHKEAALGEDFLVVVEEAVEIIRSSPLRWSRLYGNTRHYLLPRFKRHVLHYEFFQEQNLIRFYGLFHGSQDPGKWSERLS